MSSPAGPFGPPREIITSPYEISADAIEGLAQLIEQRGLRTPVSQIVGYKAEQAATRISQNVNQQTIPTGVQTNMQFAVVEFDTAKLFNAAVDNTAIIARVDGIYHASAGTSWPGGGAGTLRGLYLLVNGVLRAGDDRAPGPGGYVTVSTPVHLRVGDTLRAAVFQDSGGNLVMQGGSGGFLAAAPINRYL